MKFRVIHQQTSAQRAKSGSRRRAEPPAGRVGWINRYLDREYVRRLADTTLRTYAHNLLHFVRWWESVHHTGDVAEGDLTESTLLDYVRFQSSQQPRPSASTINDRVAIADRAIRNEFPDCSLPDRPRLSSSLFAAQADGPRPAAGGDEPIAREGAQTQHRAALGG